MKRRTSSNLYDLGEKIYKIARTLNDIEDIASGNTERMVKRHMKRNIRNNSNKTMNNIFKKIGL